MYIWSTNLGIPNTVNTGTFVFVSEHARGTSDITIKTAQVPVLKVYPLIYAQIILWFMHWHLLYISCAQISPQLFQNMALVGLKGNSNR